MPTIYGVLCNGGSPSKPLANASNNQPYGPCTFPLIPIAGAPGSALPTPKSKNAITGPPCTTLAGNNCILPVPGGSYTMSYSSTAGLVRAPGPNNVTVFCFRPNRAFDIVWLSGLTVVDGRLPILTAFFPDVLPLEQPTGLMYNYVSPMNYSLVVTWCVGTAALHHKPLTPRGAPQYYTSSLPTHETAPHPRWSSMANFVSFTYNVSLTYAT